MKSGKTNVGVLTVEKFNDHTFFVTLEVELCFQRKKMFLLSKDCGYLNLVHSTLILKFLKEKLTFFSI